MWSKTQLLFVCLKCRLKGFMGNFDLPQILRNYIPLPDTLQHGLREGTLNRRSVMSSLKFNPNKDLGAETDQRIWVTAFLCWWTKSRAAPETLRNVCFLPEAPGINIHELMQCSDSLMLRTRLLFAEG